MNRRDWMLAGLGAAGGFALAACRLSWAGADEAADGPEAKLKALKIELPTVPAPKGATIVPAVRAGDLLFLSGHLPNIGGKVKTGKVGVDVKVDEARTAAREVGLITLAVTRAHL